MGNCGVTDNAPASVIRAETPASQLTHLTSLLPQSVAPNGSVFTFFFFWLYKAYATNSHIPQRKSPHTASSHLPTMQSCSVTIDGSVTYRMDSKRFLVQHTLTVRRLASLARLRASGPKLTQQPRDPPSSSPEDHRLWSQAAQVQIPALPIPS